MKLTLLILALIMAIPSFASIRPSYVPAEIISIEVLPDSSGGTKNDYLVTYWIQPCSQRFAKLQDISLPELRLPDGVTNTSLVVVLRSNGLACAGPTEQQTVIFEGGPAVLDPRPLK